MMFNVYRGNFPFDELITQVDAVDEQDALNQMVRVNRDNDDVFMRHPVVEPTPIRVLQ